MQTIEPMIVHNIGNDCGCISIKHMYFFMYVHRSTPTHIPLKYMLVSVGFITKIHPHISYRFRALQ